MMGQVADGIGELVHLFAKATGIITPVCYIASANLYIFKTLTLTTLRLESTDASSVSSLQIAAPVFGYRKCNLDYFV